MHNHTFRETKYTTIIEPLGIITCGLVVDGVQLREGAIREGLSRRAVSMVTRCSFALAYILSVEVSVYVKVNPTIFKRLRRVLIPVSARALSSGVPQLRPADFVG